MPVMITRNLNEIVLPTERNKPSDKLGDYSIFLYGERKIGKTDLTSQFPDALHLMFEPGGNALEIYKLEMANWTMFRNTLKQLKAEPERFRTIVIDIVDNAYDMCFAHVCKRDVMDHPADVGFGKGWDAIKKEFREGIMELLNLKRGVIFVSHATVGKFSERGGLEYSKMVPTLSGRSFELIAGIVDSIWYYGYFGKHRYLKITGEEKIESGSRLKPYFWVCSTDDPSQKTSERVQYVDAGDSAEECYENLTRAFANKQIFDGSPEKNARWGLSDQKVNAFKK